MSSFFNKRHYDNYYYHYYYIVLMFSYTYKLLYSSISFYDFIIVSIFHCMLKGCDFYFAENTYYFYMNTKFDLCLSLEFRYTIFW